MGFSIVIIHEFCHYAMARALGFKGFCIELLPVGAAIKLKDLDEATIKEDILISISGPLGNFILVFLSILIQNNIDNIFIQKFIEYNLALGLFNLIPAFPLDGGRILRDLLRIKFLYKKSNEIALKFSMVIGWIILIIGIISLYYDLSNISLILIAIFILIITKKEKERVVYIIMGYIIRKKEKLIKRGYIENKSISVYYKLTLIQLLDFIDKSHYNIFTVLDDNMDVLDTIYEEDIINILKTKGNITLEELIKNKEVRV
ncbi:MAG: M50 family metallopeptidase [Clostridium sp.]